MSRSDFIRVIRARSFYVVYSLNDVVLSIQSKSDINTNKGHNFTLINIYRQFRRVQENVSRTADK